MLAASQVPGPQNVTACASPRAPDEDCRLLSDLLADAPAAWRTFNARYSRILYRAITRVTSRFTSVVSEDDVREIYANLCLQLLANDKAKLRSFDPGRGHRLSSWLTLLATHCTYDFLRSRRREPKFETVTEELPLTAQVADPFQSCELRQRARIAVELMATFTEKDREFIALYFGEGLEPEEVAQRMGISVKTVYSKKHKIQSRFESLLQRRRLAA